MNVVTLKGRFAEVHAYTDGSIVAKDPGWKIEDDCYVGQFLLYRDESFIQIRVPFSVFNPAFMCQPLINQKFFHITGELKTQIGRGTGMVSNYVKVNEVCMVLNIDHTTEEENATAH